MIKHPVTTTVLSALFLVCLIANESALAEKIRVRKVKGKNAIVESSQPLEEGQTYELATEPISLDVDYKATVKKPRDNSLSFGTQMSYLKSDTTETTSLALQLRYGWNFTSFEIGGLLEGQSVDTGTGATTSVLGGAYVDYNLVANRDPKKVIYGPFLLAAFGNTTPPSSSAAGSSSRTLVNGGAFISYFIADSTTAIRGEFFGDYEQVNTSAVQTSSTGGGIRGLLVFYF